MKEPVDKVLVMCGVLLEFANFEVLGISGFNVTTFLKEQDSTYNVDVVSYSFQVATSSIIDEVINIGDEFSYEADFHLLTFSVSTPPFPDNGWSFFKADLVSRVPL